MHRDLIQVLGSMEGHTPYSLCTLLFWTIAQSFHNLVQLLDLQFPLTTNPGHSLSIFLDHGLHRQLRQELGMYPQRRWWLLRLVLIMSGTTLPLLYTCILLSFLVSYRECSLSILMNKCTKPFHRYIKFFCVLITLIEWAWVEV